MVSGRLFSLKRWWPSGPAPLVVAVASTALKGLASMAIGYLLAGRDPEEQTTAALVTSVRNPPGLALLFAGLFAPDMEVLKLANLV